MKLFELLDFHFKYGRSGAVKLKLLPFQALDCYDDPDPVAMFDGDSSDLAGYTQYLGCKVLKNKTEPIGDYGFYRLVVTLDFDSEVV